MFLDISCLAHLDYCSSYLFFLTVFSPSILLCNFLMLLVMFLYNQAQENSNSLKKKTKFVSLYTKEGQDKLAVLIPGRHPCDCLGQKHKLINNCLICGRIVCEQEGSGPCLFCGTLVIISFLFCFTMLWFNK